MDNLKCPICGILLESKEDQAKKSKKHYCSDECRFKGQGTPKRKYYHMGDSVYIELPRGNVAEIDAFDLDLANFNWYSQKDYVIRKDKDRKYVHMHKIILERKIGRSLASHEEVDHINGNRSDNTRNNLRISNRSQNCANIAKIAKEGGRSSIYKGVSFSKAHNRYRARITYMGDTIHIGYFEREIDAAKAYDRQAIIYFGEYSNLNFKPPISPCAVPGIGGCADSAKA
jgi:hypothetical protein